MGVSVGRSGTRVYLPFWIAIPWALCVLVGCALVLLVHGTFVAGGWLWRRYGPSSGSGSAT